MAILNVAKRAEKVEMSHAVEIMGKLTMFISFPSQIDHGSIRPFTPLPLPSWQSTQCTGVPTLHYGVL